jgi:hypothetical protein
VNEAAQTSSKIHDFAQSIKTRIENSHGLGWHIVVGADFSTELRYVCMYVIKYHPTMVTNNVCSLRERMHVFYSQVKAPR